MLITLTLLLRDLGFVVYGGSLLALSILIAAAHVGAVPYLAREAAVRTYRAWGPGLGLSMGGIVLYGLAHHYMTTGGFAWPLDAPTTPAWGIFLLAWASNLRLEVWTLDPLRILDDDEDGITDEGAYREATGWLLAHLLVQNVLFLASVSLFFLAGY